MISCGKRLPIYWVDTMKIVIIGNGKIGSNLAAVLVREGHDVTVVDCEEAHLRKSQNTLDVHRGQRRYGGDTAGGRGQQGDTAHRRYAL